MSSERPSSPEVIKPSFVEQKAKEVREDLADLLESSDFSGEVQKLEQRFDEKLDREGFTEAFAHIYLAIVEGRLLGNEEQVTFEVLDVMRLRTENPNPLWLRSLTGQIVAGFMKGLARAQTIEEDQELHPTLQELGRINTSTSEERRFEIADKFFKADAHSAESMLTRLLATSTLFVQELETREEENEKGETRQVRSEFILPWLPIKQIPPVETLQDPKGGYRMVYVNENAYFPDGEARRREDFELTSKDLELIKYPKAKRSALLTDLNTFHQERFPFCMELDIKDVLEARKKRSFSTAEVLEFMSEGKEKRFKYIPASVDHHLAVAAFGWDENESPYVASLGSAIGVDEGRHVPGLWRNGVGRGLDVAWLGNDWRDHRRFLFLRKSYS